MAFDQLDSPVRTSRLMMRPATAADGETTWQYRRLASVAEWMTSASIDRAEYVTKVVKPDRLAKTLIFCRAGVVIGDLMLAVEDAWSQSEASHQAKAVQAELGSALHPEHEGHGYATEAVRGLIRISVEERPLRRVTVNCFAGNEPSWRLMEQVGKRRELHGVRSSLHRSGGWVDDFSYALLAEEWRASRA